MKGILAAGLAVGLCAASTMTATAATAMRSLPMQFLWRQEGPAAVCGQRCRTLIAAEGTITTDTPNDFAAFARRHDLHGATLVLDSGGGSVHGAIALGQEIRRLGMTTTVGRVIDLAASDKGSTPRAKLSARADCESMCAFVLLAGIKRYVPPQARVMIHQIWLGDRRNDAAAATYTAEDLVLVQRDIGRLAQYTIKMGASIDFLDLSLQVPPWEPMYTLSREEMRRFHVETGVESVSAPAVSATNPAASNRTTGGLTGLRRDPDAARGWHLAQDSGQPALMRRHPLTTLGREIGSFDLTLTCGPSADSYDISYSEHRVAGRTAVPVTSVVLSFGGLSDKLDLISSKPDADSSELSSVAEGHLPSASVQAFSKSDGRSLLVTTRSADATSTAIRVGNSGISQSLSSLQDSCSRHASDAGRPQGTPIARR